MTTPDELRALLEGAGVSQAEAARQFEVDSRSVRRWLDGSRPVPDTVADWARAQWRATMAAVVDVEDTLDLRTLAVNLYPGTVTPTGRPIEHPAAVTAALLVRFHARGTHVNIPDTWRDDQEYHAAETIIGAELALVPDAGPDQRSAIREALRQYDWIVDEGDNADDETRAGRFWVRGPGTPGGPTIGEIVRLVDEGVWPAHPDDFFALEQYPWPADRA